MGVATQNPRYTRGLDVTLKSHRCANYIRSLRRDLLKVSEAIGVVHPGLIAPEDVDLLHGNRSWDTLADTYGYEPGWGRLGPEVANAITELMLAQAPAAPAAR